MLRVQDWYKPRSALAIPEKLHLIQRLLVDTEMPAAEKVDHLFRLNFTSASTLVGGLPSVMALGIGLPFFGLRGINIRLYDLLLDLRQEPEAATEVASRGHCFLLDFCDQPDGLIELIISFNFLHEDYLLASSFDGGSLKKASDLKA